jgi:hypothetical protein
LTAGERAPSTHWIGGWVSLRTGLGDMERRKILPLPFEKRWEWNIKTDINKLVFIYLLFI